MLCGDDIQSGAGRCDLEDLNEIRKRQCDASLGRREVHPRDVQAFANALDRWLAKNPLHAA